MQGNVIDTSKGIIGGRQIQDNKEFGEALKKALMETDNPYSDLVKTTQKGPKTLEQRRKEAEEALKNKNVTPIKDPEDMAQGGRAGFAMGLGPRFIKFLNETNPIEAYKKYLQSVKKRAQEGDMKSLAPELGAVTATGVFINRRMKDVLENMKNQDMENNLENFKKELDADPFYKEYPEIKDKVLENYTETMFGEKKADGGRAGFVGGGAAKKLAQQIIKKYKGKIDDKLLNQMLADDNPQRLAEVMATIDEALIMQNKGMGPDEIVGTIKSSLDRKKQATGGRAGFANGSEGIMSLDEGAPSILLRPRASGITREQQIAPGINLSERDINYGISGILQGDKFYGGASLDKGKVKLDVETEDGQTLFKDTISKDDALNFIVGMGDPKGEKDKFQIKFDDDLENMSLILKKSFAEGGRANFDKGGMSRRKFMKIMGGIATLPFIGKYFKGAKPAAKVAEVATKTTAGQPPEYFFDLAAKIKILGKESSAARRERMVEVNYKNYTLEEDLVTGDMTIVKRKGDPEFGYEEEVMTLRKGQADEMTKGKTPPDEYEELTVRPDGDGKMKDVEDGIEPESVKEIMEEVGQGGGNLDQRTLEEIARGRLASGGVAMMLGE